MTLGQKLKELRLRHNLTLRDAAARVETDFTYLSKIENDKTDHPPSEKLLRRLAEIYGADPDDLVALSGTLPEDVRQALRENPKAVAYFRSALKRGYSPEEWANLEKKLPPEGGS